jgi:signal transduction histidine kinase
LFVLVLLVCAPLVAVMLHTAGEDRRQAIVNWQERAQRLATIAQRNEQQVLDDTHQLLVAISAHSSVLSLDPWRCKKSLAEVLSARPRYANLGVLLTNGQVLASAVPLPPAENRARRPFFRQALEQRTFAIGTLPAGCTNCLPAISFAYPVLDNTDQVLAIVFADLDSNWFDRFGSDLPGHLTRAATWTEINRAGTILAHYPKPAAWVGRAFPESALVPLAFSRPQEARETPNRAGVPSFYAFSLIQSQLVDGGVAAILSTPSQALFAEADGLLRRNLSWLAGGAAVALALGWLVSKFLILRPVRALVRSTTRLASGDLHVRTGVPRRRDELGQLTLAFDQMAQSLEQREMERQRATLKLQVLSQRLVDVQETERRHIARELHDEIGQSLTAAEMNLHAALQSPGKAALGQRLEESIQAVERVLEQVRDLSLNLRPAILDDLGLEPALRWYTHRQAALTGMQAEFRADPIEARLEPRIETECFRIAQEALTNVVRHAKARSVVVELTRQDGHLHLSVKDDGIGFDVTASRGEAVHGASLGLLSMEERAALAGGGLEFKSVAGQGTEVHAWFPLRWQGAPALSIVNE